MESPSVFEPHQSDAVIRVAAYHRRDFELTVIRSSPAEHDPVRPSVVDPFPSAPITGLGALERLPLELLSSICFLLDIRSCFILRQVNRRAREVVSSLYNYRAVAKHGLETLRAVLRTGVARYLTISDLYRPLCLGGCRLCGSEFGGFLFLPTVTRCCFACVRESPRLWLVTLSALRRRSGMTRQRLTQMMPVMRSLPGRYMMEQKRQTQRWELLVREQSLEALGFAITTRRRSGVPMISPNTAIWRYMVSTPLPLLNPTTGEVQHGLSCKGCQIALEIADAHGARSAGLSENRDRVYSREGYLEHFPTCAESITLWQESEAGTVSIREPEFTRRGGYLKDPFS
ncbi:F-box domain-containing protein [Cercophora scortea]|uniref:F-box domain-containing protein n=1 Tax=Cercophora scortea TaxID=314031 RepID=A0AAE0I3M5_9PEZI|nr:F-box domain-containing protein [Cercophora scortea]